MSYKKILIVDDDENICELIKLYLEKENYIVYIANSGKEALEIFKQKQISVILLDIMLPDLDGWDVCREIRKVSSCPIIMISSKGEVFDKVLGLELGADDYITKPFETKEVIARIRAVLRRTENSYKDDIKELSYENLKVNFTNYELYVKGKKINIPPKELELLYFLAKNPNRVYSRDQLLSEVWGYDYFGDSRTVDVHIKRLRTKLENVSEKWDLKTVWGIGYKFELKE